MFLHFSNYVQLCCWIFMAVTWKFNVIFMTKITLYTHPSKQISCSSFVISSICSSLIAVTAHDSSWYATNSITVMHVTDSILQLTLPRKQTCQSAWFMIPLLICTVHQDQQRHFHSIHLYNLCLASVSLTLVRERGSDIQHEWTWHLVDHHLNLQRKGKFQACRQHWLLRSASL